MNSLLSIVVVANKTERMNGYATALKARREQANLTVRQLSERIERSTTFITDFELRKKSNPPEPEMMERLAAALNWPVVEQLRDWGYAIGDAEQRANPFERSDPRWQLVEKLKQVDIEAIGATFTLKALGELLSLYTNDPDLFVVQSKTSLPSSLDMSASVRNNSTNHELIESLD